MYVGFFRCFDLGVCRKGETFCGELGLWFFFLVWWFVVLFLVFVFIPGCAGVGGCLNVWGEA